MDVSPVCLSFSKESHNHVTYPNIATQKRKQDKLMWRKQVSHQMYNTSERDDMRLLLDVTVCVVTEWPHATVKEPQNEEWG